ncbi:hypothetical protein WA026_015471 [Henosepilachna vigintioctopunctata]|uniref:Uncharacterized protein n=1 Tax=Henosepilachna vigintioctopunctata TaxID=420089 RepID=A0AAW1UEE1_9CUCU
MGTPFRFEILPSELHLYHQQELVYEDIKSDDSIYGPRNMGILGMYVAIGACTFDYPLGGMSSIRVLRKDYAGPGFSQIPTKLFEYLLRMLRISPAVRNTAE